MPELGDPLAEAVATAPDAPALYTPHECLNYAELDQRVGRRAETLRTRGVGPGTRVAFFLPTGAEALVQVLSILRAGGVAVPLDARLPAEQRARRLAALPQVLTLDGMTDDAPDALPARPCPPQAPATITFTSGSSGPPKAAVLSLANHLANAAASNARLRFHAGDAWLLSVPLYHVSGLAILFRALAARAAIVVAAHRSALAEALGHPRLTHVSLVPTQLYRLLGDGEATAALARLRAVLLGGAPAGAALLDRASEARVPVCTTYGMTETATQIACTAPGAARATWASVGQPLAPDSVRVTEGGGIETRGDTLFLGYLQPDGTIVRPLTPDGWFATGDLGHFDDAGHLHLAGRRDNVFIVGGENVQPEHVEAVLRDCAGVEEAIVVPVDDAEYGARPVAFVRGSVPFEGIVDHAAQHLPRYMQPLYVLPLAETGFKPSRAVLRERAAAYVRGG